MKVFIFAVLLIGVALAEEEKQPSRWCRQYSAQKDCSTSYLKYKVCDSDGNEYANSCEYYKAQCAGSAGRMAWCKKDKPETTDVKPAGEKEPSRFCKALAEGKQCPSWMKWGKFRVCGSDGKVYSNRCEMETAKCGESAMTFKYMGRGSECGAGGQGSGDKE